MNVEQYQALVARVEAQMKAKCAAAQEAHGPSGFALLNLFLAVCSTARGKLSRADSHKLVEACVLVGRQLGLEATKIQVLSKEAIETSKELKALDAELDAAYNQLPKEDRNPSPEEALKMLASLLGMSVSDLRDGLPKDAIPEIVVKH